MKITVFFRVARATLYLLSHYSVNTTSDFDDGKKVEINRCSPLPSAKPNLLEVASWRF